MIGTSRSFEHNSYAKNRAHLQPVIKSKDAFPVGRWELIGTLAIVLAFVVWAVSR